MHGGEFLRECRRAVRSEARVFITRSRQAHEETFTARYHDYLRGMESGFQRDQPALHATFEAQRRESLDGFSFSEETRARLASETSRLAVLAGFLREQGFPVLEFWEWDRRLNPEGWANRSSPERAPANSPAVGTLDAPCSFTRHPVK